MTTSPNAPATLPFLASPSRVARVIAAQPWADTPLGDARHWPAVIQCTLATWLDSPQPMCFAWGEELRFFFNDAYRPFLGHRADQALGQPFREVWFDVWTDIEPIVQRALQGEGVHYDNLPLTMTRYGYPEQTWWTFTYMPLRDEHGAVVGMMCTTTDATQHVLAEQSQRELQATLEQRVHERTTALMHTQDALRHAQKMEAVGQLTGGIAHDFNNLLTGITGALELMRRKLASGRLDPPNAERYISIAQGAAERAAALTHRLLAFARRQTLDPKPTDVGHLVHGMQDLIKRSVGPAIDLQISTDPALWPARVDAGQLDNALLNLCINARDAMPDGGRLVVRASNQCLSNAVARDHGLVPGDYLCLSVRDTGVGMSPAVIARAFEPFYTTKPLGEGTGLGLSMVYGFAQQSGGQLKIQSEVGHGTSMLLYLPRHLGEATGIRGDPSQEPIGPARAAASVLVVDDEPTVRVLITEVLEEMGLHAIESPDGQAALKVLQSEVTIDLMITDVGLPGGLNGRQLADAALTLRPGLKVLFITGYAESTLAVGGLSDPDMHILTKPFELLSLVEKIRLLT